MTPLPPDVLAALERGHAIEAIKLLRTATGLGLKQAKDVIDEHARTFPAGAKDAVAGFDSAGTTGDAGPAPGEVPRTRGVGWIVLALVVLAAVVGGRQFLGSPG